MDFGEAPDVSVGEEGPQGDIHFGVGIDAVFPSFKQTYKTPETEKSDLSVTLVTLLL